jgi:hypothetical protein
MEDHLSAPALQRPPHPLGDHEIILIHGKLDAPLKTQRSRDQYVDTVTERISGDPSLVGLFNMLPPASTAPTIRFLRVPGMPFVSKPLVRHFASSATLQKCNNITGWLG